MDYEIIHQPEQHLFKTEVDGRTAFVQYRLLGDSLDIIHTIVPFRYPSMSPPERKNHPSMPR